MTKILILSDDDRLLINLFKQLESKSKYNLDVTHILSASNTNDDLKDYFKNSTIISRDEYTRGKINKNNFALDLSEMNQFLKIEQIFNRMLDFTDPDKNFHGHERRKTYYVLLSYMKLLLDEAKPDVIFFTVVPHSPHDCILAMLAESKNIPIIIFRETNIPGLFFLSKTLLSPNKLLSNFVNNDENNNLQIKNKINDYIATIKLNNRNKAKKLYSNWRNHTIIFGNLSKLNFFIGYNIFKIIRFFVFLINCLRPIVRSIIYLIKNKIKNISQFKNLFFMDDFFKSENLSYENSKTNEFKFYYLLFQNDLKKFKLYYQYKKQVEVFDVSKKYIFFPLHYQPEATNYPYGDIFIDQVNAIKMLSMHLPSEYVIYIKEHPDTFNISRKAWVRGAFNRNLDYYTDLKKIHNVKIIPMETDVTKVIDNSVAISTLTGSTGLEAVIRSKPALVFGYPWYEDCDYVYSCRSHEECKEAINKVINLKAFNNENVNNFFTKINQILIQSKKTALVGYQKYENSDNEFKVLAKYFTGEIELLKK